jgi:hypothetical protein
LKSKLLDLHGIKSQQTVGQIMGRNEAILKNRRLVEFVEVCKTGLNLVPWKLGFSGFSHVFQELSGKSSNKVIPE